MRAPVLVAALMLLAALPCHADIKVEIKGIDADLKRNVQLFLSVERYRDRKDVDADTMTRLFNRIDGEVKNALRPFGYYEPQVQSNFRADGGSWQVDISITPGEPVRIRQVSLVVEGPGKDDPAFTSILEQKPLREGMPLNHGTYEEVKGSLLRAAAANGYLAAKLERSEMAVDIPQHSAQIDLALQTGPRYHFGKVTVDQSTIRPGLMNRFLRFKEGDPYSSTELLRTQFALDDSLYFGTVDVTTGDADAATLAVPVTITAVKSHPTLSLGAGYGTDTSVRGTIGWTDTRVNDRGHRFRLEITGSRITRSVDARYDIPIGDPALEKFSVEAINSFKRLSDVDTNTTSLTPSITRVIGNWQVVTQVSATRTTTDKGDSRQVSKLLVPGITFASVPEGFLGEALFSRALYVELIGSQKALGSDSDFVRMLVQSEHQFDLTPVWHVLLRGELGASLVSHFSELPGIYRFFAGGDRSVRGFAVNSLSPQEPVVQDDGSTKLEGVGGRDMLTGSFELVRDLPRNLAVATFFDAGNAFNHFGDKLEYAAGVGLRYRLPVVSIGIDVAKPMSTGGPLRFSLNITPKL